MQQQSEQGENVTVLPDATREEMLEAAGMTTGHRWEDTFVREVRPDSSDDDWRAGIDGDSSTPQNRKWTA